MEDKEAQKHPSKGAVNILGFSERVDGLADELLGLLKTTDSQALMGIRPYVEPRKNICKIIAFYELFESTTREFWGIKSELEKSQLLQRSQKEAVEIEVLEKFKVLDLMGRVNRQMVALGEFEDVKIVSRVLKDMKELMDRTVEMIEQSILVSLKRLPKVVEKLDIYARFALNYRESDKFIEAYTDMVLKRMGFAGIENNFAVILQRTKNLTAHFNIVIDFNRRVLGRKRSRAINDGLVKLMVLDLKKILADTLGRIEAEKKPEHIPFLIQLYARLRHSDGNMVEEIEELFVFKEEILTIMFNCSLHFLMETGLQAAPNNGLREERMVALLVDILTQFDRHKEVKRAWVEKYGSSFGVHAPEELNSNLAGKMLQVIDRLSKSLDVEEKAIYTTNNIHRFKDLTTKIAGHDLKHLVYKNCETIVGMWKISLGDLERASLNTALIENLDRSRRYYLPEEERRYVVGKVRGMLQDLIARGKFDSNPQVILDKISVAYSGSQD